MNKSNKLSIKIIKCHLTLINIKSKLQIILLSIKNFNKNMKGIIKIFKIKRIIKKIIKEEIINLFNLNNTFQYL
jgi:hypothetical protein